MHENVHYGETSNNKQKEIVTYIYDKINLKGRILLWLCKIHVYGDCNDEQTQNFGVIF